MIVDVYKRADGSEMQVAVPDPVQGIKLNLPYSSWEKLLKVKMQLKARFPERRYVSYSDAVEYLLWLATESIEDVLSKDGGQQSDLLNSANDAASR